MWWCLCSVRCIYLSSECRLSHSETIFVQMSVCPDMKQWQSQSPVCPVQADTSHTKHSYWDVLYSVPGVWYVFIYWETRTNFFSPPEAPICLFPIKTYQNAFVPASPYLSEKCCTKSLIRRKMSHDNNKYLGLCSGLLVNTIMASSSLLRWTFNCLLAVCLIASFCQFLMLVYFIDIISLYIILLYSNIFAGDQL